jgi:hypothetical protein
LADQSLSEAVIALQRQDLAHEAREVVEEAARLLGEGRDGEARALLEKAEALAATNHGDAQEHAGEAPRNGNGTHKVNGSAGPAIQAIVEPLAARLAAGFTAVLTSVLEDIHRYTGEQIHFVVESLEEHIQHTEESLRAVTGLDERVEQLANEHQVAAQFAEQSHSMLWNAIHGAEESGRQQAELISRVTAAMEELSHHVADQVEDTAARFVDLEQRVSQLDQFAQDTPPQLVSLIERLDGHSEALRVLEERQTQRVSTLNQVLDSLARLRETEEPEMGMSAVQ